MFALVDWLKRQIPPEDASGATAGLVHGDFRIDNLVFHPTEVRYIQREYTLSLSFFG